MTSTSDTGQDLRSVRRQQAVERRRLREQRSLARDRRDEVARKQVDRVFIRKTNAVVTGLVPRISGAIDSWAGKRVPLRVSHPAQRFAAFTDFTSIVLDIPALREDQEMTVDFAADLRGLAYHEAGHILVSVPFTTLLNTVMPLAEGFSSYARQNTLERLCADYNTLHHAWNCLEDQRMESAMVRLSKNLGRYYNVIVLTHVLNNEDASPEAFLLLHGRKHVTADVRSKARVAFRATYGEQVCAEAERLIDTYSASNSLQEMWECVAAFTKLTGGLKGDMPNPVDGHGDPDENMSDEEVSKRFGRSHSDEKEDGQGQPGDETDEADDEAEGKGQGEDEGEGDEADDEGVPTVADRAGKGEGLQGDSNIGADHSISDPQWNRDVIREAIRKAKEERDADQTLIGDVRAFNEALADSRNGLPIHRIPTVPNPDPAVTFEATKLNRALRTLMEQARAERAPSWQEGCTQGQVDVIRYKTRQPGDLDFFVDYAEGGDMHLPNMAVSLVLDGSGSMLAYNQSLAQAAYGVKTACDVVGVPCTVTVYDTDAYLLWSDQDRPLDVPLDVVPSGGTDPKLALDLLDTQAFDRDNHLVIIMTDGAWGRRWHSKLSLANYAAPNRDLVMFFWNTPITSGPDGMEVCSLVKRLDTLAEIPNYLRRYLLRAL